NIQHFEEKDDVDEWLNAEITKHMSMQGVENMKDALISIIKSIKQEMKDDIMKNQFEASTASISNETSSITSNEVDKDDNNTASCRLPKELSPGSFLLPFNIDNHSFYMLRIISCHERIGHNNLHKSNPEFIFNEWILDSYDVKEEYAREIGNPYSRRFDEYNRKTNEAWHDEAYEEDEMWRSGDEKTDYDPPYVNIKTFEVKKFSFKGGRSFLCITDREDEALPLGRVNGARFKAMIRKELEGNKHKEAEYAGLKEAEYAGLNQAKYDRLIPSEICIQAEYDICQAKYDRLIPSEI
ncbi:hypothetical protein Tco_0345573, partial [Tanacetum coccineum]